MSKTTVAIAMPCRAPVGHDADALARGVVTKALWDTKRDQPGGRFAVVPGFCWSSVLPHTFDLLWAGALSDRKEYGLDYFAMIHDDVVPDLGWLGVMVDELERTGVDLLSAVIPIKTAHGTTSTAIDGPDPWKVRRITMREVYDLPETFADADVGGELLVNTGLWVCRMDRPWLDAAETDASGAEVLRLSFHQQNRVVKLPDGSLLSQLVPEDWDFSRRWRSAGGKLAATRKVGLYHERPEYTNRRPWGTLKSDTQNCPGCEPLGRKAAPAAA